MDSLSNRDFIFDIGKLLAPISPDSPSGESLRYDVLYDQIREGRREDDPVQERGVWVMPLKRADWAAVEKLCVEALSKRSKDLQIAGWLLEAWVREYGLAGLREGFRLLNALCQDFWDTLYPLPEDGDLEYRVAPFEWINEKVSVIVKLIPITNPHGDEVPAYNWFDWETACRPSSGQLQTFRGQTVEPKLSQEQFQDSVARTHTLDLKVLLELTDGALNSLNMLSATLDAKCGHHSPGLGRLSSILTSVRGLLFTSFSQRPESKSNRPENSMDLDVSSIPVDPNEQTPDEAIESGALSSGPIRSRAEAYRRLVEASDYLVRTEPHSPVPYLVKRAIGWGNLNLQDLLPELVRNNSELSDIYRLLQIGRPE
jgi:type VI secretion system protein ImpA